MEKNPLLNLELLNDFFTKNTPKTPKIELRQTPKSNIADTQRSKNPFLHTDEDRR